MLGMLRVLGPLLAMACLAQSSRPPYPVWPQQFTAEAIQSQNGSLQYTTLYYDWPGGRNLILIQEQQGALTWDMEWTNGTSYFFNREVQQLLICSACHPAPKTQAFALQNAFSDTINDFLSRRP